uniref:Uncharacterized protein n=1 Tax=Knipowitschia caucasica TaxID=637954 RepID=A0AAV2KUQ7_KNICA
MACAQLSGPLVCGGPLLLLDNGGSTINSNGKWPGGDMAGGGWLVVLDKRARRGGGGVEDSGCVKAALNYIHNHPSVDRPTTQDPRGRHIIHNLYGSSTTYHLQASQAT